MGVERIMDGERPIAIIVSGDAKLSGRNFFTADSEPLQFGVNIYEIGDESRPHLHVENEVPITQSQEMLHIDYGRVQLDLFTDSGKHICTRVLRGGDSVFFVSGGHGLKFIEPTKIVEVKQGPYLGVNKDKKFI